MSDPTVTGPMPFRILLDEAMKKTREHFRAMFLPFALPLAALSTAWSAGYIAWVQGFANQLEQGGLEGSAGGAIGAMAAVGCSTIVLAIATALVYLVLWAASVDAVAGRPIAIKESWRFVVRGNVFATLVLAGLFLLIAFMFCFFPSVYVGLLLAFLVPVLVEENLQGMDAIRRSAFLVRYNPQRRFLDAPIVKIFILGVVAMVISTGFSLLINLPVSILQNAMQFRESSGGTIGVTGWLWLSVPLQAISSLTWTIVQIYLSMGVSLLYFDVRRRREAGDLEAALDALMTDAPE